MPVYFLLVILLFSVPKQTAAAPGTADTETNEVILFNAPIDAPDPNETLRLVNAERISQGALPLIADAELGQVAAARAADMAARQYYAHKNPDGKYYFNLFEKFGVTAGYSCENLDLVFVPSQDLVIHEWMASLRGHRACMLDTKVKRAGYATAKLNLKQFDGSITTAYLVVAVHAEVL
ncbi:hypothetical protein H0X10_01110 [Candidatus Saccharibacteria bacterium]|nr:hypothetical protein [Candidatus Saccharibacteria bacterium]